MPTKRKTSTSTPPKRKLPEWITSHFRDSLNAHETLMQIIHISEQGISVLREMPEVVKVIADVEGTTDAPSTSKRLEQAEKEAALAVAELEKGFPVLHGLAVVALWSWLEHSAKGFIALWLRHRRDAISVSAVHKLRVKLGDYLQLGKEEQAQFLVELLEQDLASPLKRGVNRFESLLEPFGLSDALPDGCARTIFELQQVRNAFAHRNGRADRRLCAECPWLKLKPNQPVQVSREMLIEYSSASLEFLLTLLYRVGDVYGIDLREQVEEAPDPSLKRHLLQSN